MIEQHGFDMQKMSDLDHLDDLNRTLYDIGAQDLLEVWGAVDSEDLSRGASALGASNSCWSSLLGGKSQTPVLKDRLLTDSVALNGEEFPVSTEHSYSLGAGSDGDSMPASPISLEDDIETECYPCIPMQSASNQSSVRSSSSSASSTASSDLGGETITIKKEPLTPETDINVVDDEDLMPMTPAKRFKTETRSNRHHTVRLTRPKHPQSLLKQPPLTHTIVLTTPPGSSVLTSSTTTPASGPSLLNSSQNNLLLSRLSGKTDDESSLLSSAACNRTPIQTSLISSQPADGTGVLQLTEEEKKTLIAEGYPIPSRLPLTKAEEKSLKKIRRKIKNKISAQESRRKKKEFVDTLERRCEMASLELGEYKKKCQVLEKEKAQLISQLKSLRAMVASNDIKCEPEIKMEPDTCESVLSNGLELD